MDNAFAPYTKFHWAYIGPYLKNSMDSSSSKQKHNNCKAIVFYTFIYVPEANLQSLWEEWWDRKKIWKPEIVSRGLGAAKFQKP